MNLRYLQYIDVYKKWDKRDDETYTSEYKREPILQYQTEDGEWKIVPTVQVERTHR